MIERMCSGGSIYIFDSDIERFGKKLCKVDGCWNWIKPMTTGYGMFSFDGKSIYAHRFSYLIYNGDIESGLLVRHTCDNKKCVNPEHLVLGSNKDNSNDMVSRNRQTKTEDVSLSKLTNSEVLELREMESSGNYSVKELSDAFGVCESSINKIIKRDTWASI